MKRFRVGDREHSALQRTAGGMRAGHFPSRPDPLPVDFPDSEDPRRRA